MLAEASKLANFSGCGGGDRLGGDRLCQLYLWLHNFASSDSCDRDRLEWHYPLNHRFYFRAD